MPQLFNLSHTEIVLGFAASCIEFVARRLGASYKDVYASLKRTDALERYIIPHYNVLHTQSREHVTEDIINYLRSRGERI